MDTEVILLKFVNLPYHQLLVGFQEHDILSVLTQLTFRAVLIADNDGDTPATSAIAA